ncbi:MAG: damage-control phosphatase ARMT1 family protein [Desulfopila sp.]
MKTAPECFACFMQQAVRVAKMVGCDDLTQMALTKDVAALLVQLDDEASPPANAIGIYEAIRARTGCVDPYLKIKRLENQRALGHLPLLRTELAGQARPLPMAIRFAIAANRIDYGIANPLDADAVLRRCRTEPFAVDHRQHLLAAVRQLQPGGSILYLADNCGEIVYDALVVEILARQGLAVTVAVRESPIINDALREDAEVAGLGQWASIVSNGTACPGTPLARCTEEFRALFDSADLVISKGQGNFESLAEVQREMFFLLTVKCPIVADYLNRRLTGEERLRGEGEMVVYHSAAPAG